MNDQEGDFGIKDLRLRVLLAGRWENIDAVKRRAVLSKREDPAISRMELSKRAWTRY
jgi:hypothetical protein